METEITFNPSGQSGLVAVGTYLIDAAKRLGVKIEPEETAEGEVEIERYVVKVTEGANLLSPPTKFESEYLSEELRKQGSRLADQTKIEKEGAVTVMVKEKKEPEAAAEEKKAKESRKEFEELPLEKKVSQLLELEMITLSETFSFIFNSPYKVLDKVMDVMAEFGLKMDKNSKEAARPEEHRNASKSETKQTKKSTETTGETA